MNKNVCFVSLLFVLLLAFVSVANASTQVFAFEDAEYTVHVGKTIHPKPVAQGIEGRLSYVWSSSDEHIATVKDGVIKGVAGGTVSITCTATDKEDKTYEAQTTVHVLVPIKSITADKKSIELVASSEFTAKFKYQTGDKAENEYQMYKPTLTITPSDASVQQLEWSSDEDLIATVTDDGTIYGISVGTTTITGIAMDGSGKSVKIKVTVPGCFVTEDKFVITEPAGAILGYVYPRIFVGSGITSDSLRTKGDTGVFALADLDDANGMEMKQIVPLKAGKASLLFVRNGKTLKKVNIEVKHSAVYDNVSYPAVKISKILASPKESIGIKTQAKCEVIKTEPQESLGNKGGLVYGMLTENGERYYVVFEYDRAMLLEIGETYTIFGEVSDFVEYVTETGLVYSAPYFVGGHIN